ncbi:hypothetical protein H257_19281 [Aphanomyces astaci]|uniref:Uncharacterized protein n=1 Tax=Aphanomyces astaci TaxID=112090 RepID=W4F8I3_APHAT|nr:hypothetical protein H257_19281 [Aphanomyces astaci]ETV63790.1 hypothetical protein H257_19281 [Aphanomyces astaci]|eukprot:XP_009846728.1 hypothetical protein H257_19281 [Aphanomyces astaci]
MGKRSYGYGSSHTEHDRKEDAAIPPNQALRPSNGTSNAKPSKGTWRRGCQLQENTRTKHISTLDILIEGLAAHRQEGRARRKTSQARRLLYILKVCDPLQRSRRWSKYKCTRVTTSRAKIVCKCTY